MLSKGDDFPIHQSPEPIAYAGQSRNFYDRYFFNGYDIGGDVFFALGMGVYPHLDVIDAGFSLIRNGVQYNIWFACSGHGADGHRGRQHQGRCCRTTALSAHSDRCAPTRH